MLLHQAVRGFQLWFGVRPEVTAELRALVEADLRAGLVPEPEKPQTADKKRAKRRKGAAP
jgi:hypothetical protein